MKTASKQQKAPKLNVRLLRRVQKHILEEPLRFDMGTWGSDDYKNEPDAPPCGTVACIAGWACLLGGVAKNTDEVFAEKAADLISPAAPELAHNLFYTGCWPEEFMVPHDKVYNEFDDAFAMKATRRKLRALRRKMAKIAAERIDHFIKTKGAE